MQRLLPVKAGATVPWIPFGLSAALHGGIVAALLAAGSGAEPPQPATSDVAFEVTLVSQAPAPGDQATDDAALASAPKVSEPVVSEAVVSEPAVSEPVVAAAEPVIPEPVMAEPEEAPDLPAPPVVPTPVAEAEPIPAPIPEPVAQATPTPVPVTVSVRPPHKPQQIAAPPEPQPEPEPVQVAFHSPVVETAVAVAAARKVAAASGDEVVQNDPEREPDQGAGEGAGIGAGSVAASAGGERRSASFSLGSAENPKPRYPRLARLRGWQGRVVLRVTVTPEGVPTAVTVEASSGFLALDRAAVKAVRAWRFRPARFAGSAVADTVRVPIRFELAQG
jgi:protein TonB